MLLSASFFTTYNLIAASNRTLVASMCCRSLQHMMLNLQTDEQQAPTDNPAFNSTLKAPQVLNVGLNWQFGQQFLQTGRILVISGHQKMLRLTTS